MLYKKLNLRTSTILDLNDSEEVRKEFGLVGYSSKEYNENLAVQTRILDWLGYAEITKDIILEKAVFKTFSEEFKVFGFE